MLDDARVEGGEVDAGPAEEEEGNKVCEMRLGTLMRVLMWVWGVNLRLPKEQSKSVADGWRLSPPIRYSNTARFYCSYAHVTILLVMLLLLCSFFVTSLGIKSIRRFRCGGRRQQNSDVNGHVRAAWRGGQLGSGNRAAAARNHDAPVLI